MSHYNTSQFDWDKATQTFSAEASSLARVGTALFRQIYPDACDEGLTLVSYRTGFEADFAVETVDGNEGDIFRWVLRPTAATARRFPALRDVSVVIYND